MKLGEAYVNIRADLKPYYRDLQVGIKATTDAFEKQINKDLGRKLGKNISVGAREELVAGAKTTARDVSKEFESVGGRVRTSVRKGTRDGGRQGLFDVFREGGDVFTFIASSLAGALDDGISALPREVKAGLIGGLALASPIILAQLGSLIGAALSVGVAALGIGLASQLQPVQTAFEEVLTNVRDALVESAGPLIDPILKAFDFLVEYIGSSIAPRLEALFTQIAPGIQTLLQGVVVFVEKIFEGLQAGGEDINGFLETLGVVIGGLGKIFGESFRVLLSTGRDGRAILTDLVTVVGSLVLAISALLAGLIEIYGVFRDIAAILSGDITTVVLNRFNDEIAKQKQGVFVLGDAYGGLVVATDKETKAIEDQNKALEENRKALKKITDAAIDLLDFQIDAEESWDRLTEGIKEHGRSLDIDDAKGRENARNVRKYLEDRKKALQEQVEQGKITADEAEVQFGREVTAVEKLFGKTKETRTQFQGLFADIIKASKAELDPSPWVTAFNKIGSAILTAINRIKELQRLARQNTFSPNQLSGMGGGGEPGRPYANGGRITTPTFATLGEGSRPEIVLPETKPRRAAEILASSPLGQLLGGNGTSVTVYIGDEQLLPKMVTVAQGVNKQNARTINARPRSI